jgi:hypothetical protein
MRSQSYTRELEQMNRQIQEQERKKQETLARIEKERKDRDIAFGKELEKERQIQKQINEKERKVNEEILNRGNLTNESKITSGSQEKINQFNRELAEKKRELDEHIRQSQARKNASQRKMEAYIEQLLKY